MSDAMSDPYVTGECEWWHLSSPSPELEAAIADGWIGTPGRVLDLGCGLGSELAHLAERGWEATGIDLSHTALGRARALHPRVRFVRGDVTNLPFRERLFDVLLDRGCLHYLAREKWPRYADEAQRVLGPGGRFLLRVCLRPQGLRNWVDDAAIRSAFRGWRITDLRTATVPSDTRSLDAIVARLEAPQQVS